MSAALVSCSSDTSDSVAPQPDAVVLDATGDANVDADTSAPPDTGRPDSDAETDLTPESDTGDVANDVETPDAVDASEDSGTDECSDALRCASGFTCQSGQCVSLACEVTDPPSCQDSATVRRCFGGTLRAVPCIAGSECVDGPDGGACTLPPCDANAIGCADGFTAFICDGQGDERFLLPCNNDQFCQDGVCQSQVCTPSEATCAGSVSVACSASGDELTTEDCIADCPAGLFCSCLAGRCRADVCSPSSSRCEGNVRVICSADGQAETRSSCGSDVCIDGACVPTACEASTATCFGDVLSTCSADGTQRTQRDCTESNSYCNAGACQARTCTPSSSICQDIDTRSVCDARGTGRSDADCPNGTYCDAGACVPSVCTPGQTRCSGQRLQECDRAGSGFVNRSCTEGQICQVVDSVAICAATVCQPGQRTCSSDLSEVLVCNAGQTGYDVQDCLAGQVCSAGTCISSICTNGATRCTGVNVETCVENGTRWQSSICPAGQSCQSSGGSATCGSLLCAPSSPAICRNGDVQVCNGAGTAYNTVFDCPFGCANAECTPRNVGRACATSGTCGGGFVCSNGTCVPDEYVLLPAGAYTVGTNRTDSWISALEAPEYIAQIARPVMIGNTEVTQIQWRAVLVTNPSDFVNCGNDCPVESVNFWDVLYYLNQVSAEEGVSPCYELTGCTGTPGTGCPPENTSGFCTGSYVCSSATYRPSCTGYRLPTNAEWEAAARDGLSSDYPAGNYNSALSTCTFNSLLAPYATYCGNSTVAWSGCADLSSSFGPACAGPFPVASREATGDGYYDLLGNVYEWVWDTGSTYSTLSVIDPRVLTIQSSDVGLRRGGGWWSYNVNARLTLREAQTLSRRTNLQGFRWARTVFPASCYNGVRDGGETLVDCGGTACGLCN